jgi:hypothetical protein
MKKQLKKKLTLQKSTISSLDVLEKQQVKGGSECASCHWMNCYPFTGGRKCHYR